MKTNGIYNDIFGIQELILTREIHKIATKLIQAFNPKKEVLTVIKWSTYIGKQKWKNTPLIIGNSVFVGSAGNIWNEKENDGIYCLDVFTGIINRFRQTFSDVNEISNYWTNFLLKIQRQWFSLEYCLWL
jgi:hypothetical protein